jgi:predicted N-acyltransferase
MYAVETFDSIESVEPEVWDRLVPDNALASHGWLRTLERSTASAERRRYVLARHADRLVAAAACYGFERSTRSIGLDDLMFGRLTRVARSLGLSFLPALQLGAPGAYGDQVLIDPGLDEPRRREVLGLVLDVVQQMAFGNKTSVFCSNLFETDRALLEALADRGFHRTRLLPVCYVDVVWDSFASYVDDLAQTSRNMAASVRKEVSRNRRSGVKIGQIEDVDAHEEELHRLADLHWRRYNSVPFPYGPGFFGTARRMLGDDAVLYGAFRDSRLFGFMLLLRRGEVAFASDVGIDHDVSGDSATYFNLCFYEPIREAIGTGLRRIYYGRGVPKAKIRRGCKVRSSFLCYRSPNRVINPALRPLFAMHSRWISRKSVAFSHAPAASRPGEGR